MKAGAAKKRISCDVDRILELDERGRSLGQAVDEMRSRQKSAGKAISQAPPEERASLAEAQKTL